MSPVAWALFAAVRTYKLTISPFLPPSCRFEPTCSRYAEDALRRFGARRGARLAVRRILRCRPGVEGGYDPAPLE
jgi:putative membrane protein insertion efficiency factor